MKSLSNFNRLFCLGFILNRRNDICDGVKDLFIIDDESGLGLSETNSSEAGKILHKILLLNYNK